MNNTSNTNLVEGRDTMQPQNFSNNNTTKEDNMNNRVENLKNTFKELKLAVSKLPANKFPEEENVMEFTTIEEEPCTEFINLMAQAELFATLQMECEINGTYLDDSTLSRGEQYEYSLAWALDAATGDDEAKKLLLLAILYNTGVIFKYNYLIAMKYYEEAAIAGNPIAMFQTGVCYSYGFGRPYDLDKAIMYLKQASDAGIDEADNQLEKIYMNLEEEADTENTDEGGWHTL